MAVSRSEQVVNIPRLFKSRETYPLMDGRSVSTLIRPESGPKLRLVMRRRPASGAAAGVGIASDLHAGRRLDEYLTIL